MIFESILEILSGLFIILGSLLVLIGAIGFLGFQNFGLDCMQLR